MEWGGAAWLGEITHLVDESWGSLAIRSGNLSRLSGAWHTRAVWWIVVWLLSSTLNKIGWKYLHQCTTRCFAIIRLEHISTKVQPTREKTTQWTVISLHLCWAVMEIVVGRGRALSGQSPWEVYVVIQLGMLVVWSLKSRGWGDHPSWSGGRKKWNHPWRLHDRNCMRWRYGGVYENHPKEKHKACWLRGKGPDL